MKEEIYRFGRCEVHVQHRSVTLDGQPQRLEPRPFDLLVFLIRHRGRVVTTSELLERFWTHQVVTVGVIARAILKARQAIGDRDQGAPMLRTFHRTGYRFVAELGDLGDGSGGSGAPGGPALAQARQAVAEQRWRLAGNLFRAVLEREPDNLPVQVEHLKALAALGDDAALALGPRLLEQARATQDGGLLAAVHLALGRAHGVRRAFGPARFHLDEALRLADFDPRGEWLPEACLRLSSIALFEHDVDRAVHWLDRAREFGRDGARRAHRIAWARQAAWLHERDGDLARAVQHAREAREIAFEGRLAGDFAVASRGLSGHCAQQGLMGAAIGYAEEAFRLARELGMDASVARTADTLCWLYRELRQPAEAARIVDALAAEPLSAAALLPATLMARGHGAAAAQDHARAVACWSDAVARARELGAVWPEHIAAPWLVTALIQSSGQEEAVATLRALRARPAAAADAVLQAALQHCEALLLHRRGDAPAALERLLTVIDTAPMGAWRACASLDAAWLCAEAGDAARGRKLVRDLGPWLDEHPAGRAVQARLRFGEGDFAAAHRLQQGWLAALRTAPPDHHAEIAAVYQRAAHGHPSTPPSVPTLGWLPTRS